MFSKLNKTSLFISTIKTSLVELDSYLTEEYIIKYYDSIMLRLSSVNTQWSWLSTVISDKEKIEKQLLEDIHHIYMGVINKLKETGEKQRGYVLDVINVVDTSTSSVQEIKNAILTISKFLNLDWTSHNERIGHMFLDYSTNKYLDGVVSCTGISLRQQNSLLRFSIGVMRGQDLNELFHYFVEFIDNYGNNKCEPFNGFERTVIRSMLECLIYLCSENVSIKS